MPHDNHGIRHLLRNRELNELYASVSINTFAIALTGIFIPIYLYQLGYTFQGIFLFFASFSIFNLLALFPSAKIASKFGLKHTILLSMPFLIIFFLLLYSIESFNWPLWFISIFGGIYSSLFWISYHTDFTGSSQSKSRGSQVGLAKVLISGAGALSPVIGGLILVYLGFQVLFLIVSILLVASTLPLFMSREIHEPASFSFEGLFKGTKFRDILGYFGFGIENRIATIIWPLFIFIFILSERYLMLGAVSSISFGLSLISTVAIAKFSDFNRRLVLKSGTLMNALIWVGKSFIVTPVQVFIADAFQGISRTAIHVPFDALNYDKIDKKEDRIKKILQREMYIKIGATLFLIFVAFTIDDFVNLFRFGGGLSSLMQFFF